MKISATKIFKFEMAHQLETCYSEECQNIHGHGYKLEVTISCLGLNKDGMVCDFKKLKEIIEPVVNQFDHTFLNKENFNVNPTSENIAWTLFKSINEAVSIMAGGSALLLQKIKLWETDTCFVTVEK